MALATILAWRFVAASHSRLTRARARSSLSRRLPAARPANRRVSPQRGRQGGLSLVEGGSGGGKARVDVAVLLWRQGPGRGFVGGGHVGPVVSPKAPAGSCHEAGSTRMGPS